MYRQVLIPLLCGVALFAGVGFIYRDRITTWYEIRVFLQEYEPVDQIAKESIAAQYLPILGSHKILNALEQQNPLCHSEAHPVGREIFRETQSLPESLQQCGSSCSYGCFHGVLMQMFSTDSDNFAGALTGISDQDIFTQIINSVPTFCARADVSSVVVPWICLHGIGHVVMYIAHYDIPTALTACKKLPNATEASICAGGAFMEYIRSDANAAAVSKQDFFPCDLFPDFAKPCFVYKGQPMVKAYGHSDSAIAACRTLASTTELLSCIRGVGVGAVDLKMLQKEHGLDPVCGELSGNEQAACIDGAVSSIVFRMEAHVPACSTMAQPYSQYCAAESAQLRNLTLE